MRSVTVLPIQLIPLQPFEPDRLVVPLLIIALVPAILALALRRKAGAGAIYAWSRWLLVGLWLYWIEAVNLGNIAAFATGPWFHHATLGLLAGVLLYALPPSTATAVCLSALAPRRGAWVQFAGLVAHAPAAAVVFSLLFVGYRLYESAPWVWMASIPCTLLVMQAANRLTNRNQGSQVRRLDAGDLRERVMDLARRAGVPVQALYVRRNREPGLEKAVAVPAGGIMITEGLLAHATRREVDAAVAHQLAVLRGRYRSALNVASVLTTVACIAYIPILSFTDRGDTVWGRTLPLVLLLCLLLPSQLSQRQALAADLRGTGLTDDPEGLIALLGRVAQLNQTPLAWGSARGALLPLPSPRRRALALAQHFNLPADRALGLLEHPEILTGDAGYSREAGIQRPHPAYNAGSLAAHVLSLLRWMRVFLIVGSLLLYLAAATFGPPYGRLPVYLCGAALLFWLYLRTDLAMDRRFLRRKERNVGANRPGILVGLRCGDEVGDPYPWDLGRLSLTAEGLVYRGERAVFRVPREQVTGIEERSGPLSWERHYLVVVRWSGGSFTLEPTLGMRSRAKVSLFESQLQAWWRGEGIAPAVAGAESLPLPDLPPVPWQPLPGQQIALRLAMRAGGLLLVTTLCMMLLDIARANLFAIPGGVNITSLVTTPVPLTPAAIYVIAALPAFFRKR